MQRCRLLPVTVLSGFLGAGKTTVLNHVDEALLARIVPGHLVGGRPVEAHVFHRQGDKGSSFVGARRRLRPRLPDLGRLRLH